MSESGKFDVKGFMKTVKALEKMKENANNAIDDKPQTSWLYWLFNISTREGTIARKLFIQYPIQFGNWLAKKSGNTVEYIQALIKKVYDGTATEKEKQKLKELSEKNIPTDTDIEEIKEEIQGGRKSRKSIKSKKSKKSKKTKTRRRK